VTAALRVPELEVGRRVRFVGLLVALMYILIRSEVQVEQKYNELAPLLVGQDDHRLVAVFSSPSRAGLLRRTDCFIQSDI
jgi:hypothetical protein